ncbi:MAG TPA: polysaccharide biosynthesis tyrosine autokinase [Allosphingosinicella sp.]|nr:polysaccharide biosynthesis tyrosine autokinase [Allosphingosinicella sp.]
MSRNDLQPTAAGPVWPLAAGPAGDLALGSNLGAQRSWAMPEINIATIWRIVSEWRWLVLGFIGVALAGAIIVSLLTTPQFRAVATLEINPPQVEIMQNQKGQAIVPNDNNFLATQYGLLRSRTLAERVVQQLNLASNPDFLNSDADRSTREKIAAGILTSNFAVEPVPTSRLVKISYSSPSPDLAARIANSFADSFINTNLERRYQASSYAREFLQNQISKVKNELEKSERLLVAYAQQQGIINTAKSEPEGGRGGDADSLTGASLVSINEALAGAQTKRIVAEQAYRQALSVGNTSDVTQGTSPLRTTRAQLEAEYQQKLSSFKPDYPDMVRLKAQIEGLDKQIARESGTLTSSRIATALADYRAAAASERELQVRVNQLKGDVLDLRGRSIRYTILQREVDTNRSLYDALLQRYKEIGVAGGIGTNQVSVVDRAEAPGWPYKPNLSFNLAVGLLLGVIGGVGAAIALEFVNDTVKTPDDVRDKLGLASLGVIPRKQGQNSLAEELSDQSSEISEAYFSLRTSLQFSTDSGAPKSLLITSTRPAEGKSSTTLALAQNFARLGNRVLLIDADLRKPAFTTGSEPSEGLSKLLTNQDALRAHVLKTQFENLWLVPCGPLPPNPAELLASPRLRALINEAASHFDMVIVDGPPVLGLADAPLLSGACRATLLVVESGKTRTPAVIDAINRLRSAGSHIIGAVLTKYRHRVGNYGYNYEPYRYGGIESRDREIRLIAQREA